MNQVISLFIMLAVMAALAVLAVGDVVNVKHGFNSLYLFNFIFYLCVWLSV